MLGFGQAMVDIVLGAGKLEGMGAEAFAPLHRQFDVGCCRGLVSRGREKDAVIGQHGVDRVIRKAR